MTIQTIPLFPRRRFRRFSNMQGFLNIQNDDSGNSHPFYSRYSRRRHKSGIPSYDSYAPLTHTLLCGLNFEGCRVKP